VINLSLPLIEAFIALEDCLQFTQGAKRCNVSQSAFSQMIARLEAQVGARLFDRDTRSVRLTPEGELFSRKARKIALDIDSALMEMRDYTEKRRGKLALAVPPSLAADWVPSILHKYRELYPGISLELFDTYSERGLQLLRECRVEIAVTAQPGNTGEFSARLLFEEPFQLACHTGHAIATRQELQLDDFADLPMIHLVSTESIRVTSNSKLHKLRPLLRELHVRETGLEVEHLATLAGLIDRGMGVSVVPQLSLSQFGRTNVAMVPISRQAFMRQIFMVKRHGQSLSPAGAAFVELMEESLPY
jgi:LysR family carnitine catabolism transcriptional activator